MPNIKTSFPVHNTAVPRQISTYVKFKSDDTPLWRLLPEETATNFPNSPEKTVEIMIAPVGGKPRDEYGVGRVVIVVSDGYLVIQVGRR